MKRLLAFGTGMVLVVLLTVHASAPAASHPGTLRDKLQEAVNRGDLAGAMALWADDAAIDNPGACPERSLRWQGRDPERHGAPHQLEESPEDAEALRVRRHLDDPGGAAKRPDGEGRRRPNHPLAHIRSEGRQDRVGAWAALRAHRSTDREVRGLAEDATTYALIAAMGERGAC